MKSSVRLKLKNSAPSISNVLRTSEAGVLIDPLAEIEKEGKTFVYCAFETKYQDALQSIPNSRRKGSANYNHTPVWRMVRAMIDDGMAASHGDFNSNVEGHKPCVEPFRYKGLLKLVDYRLVCAALVFKVAWLNKDYKIKDRSDGQCIKAAGYMLELEELLNNIVRRRKMPCSGHQE